MNLIKVEIKDLDKNEWQWLGKLSEASILRLTEFADTLSDQDVESNLEQQNDN